MKSPKVKGIGEVVTEYGAKVMKIFKKGLLGRSLFDFYGDVKAQTFRTKESASAPSTPTDGAGGIMYTKSADGKLYYKSNEVSEVEISSTGATLTTEEVQDIVGAMFTSNTETRISAAYEDSDGTIDLVVDAIPVDLTSDGAGTIHANNVPTLNQDTTGNAATATNAQGITGATDGDVSITSDGNVTVKLDADNDETFQRLKITNNADTEVAYISEVGDIFLRGKITNSGSDADLDIESDGNMIFVLDRDNDETGQYFSFNNFSTEIARLDETGDLQIDGDLTVSGSGTTSIGGTLSCADLDIAGSSNALTVNSTTGNVAINASSTDADCMVRVQDNSTAGTNAIGMVATGDDLVMRNDEGNFKVKVANNATDALTLDQSGNLDVTGRITGKQYQVFPTNFIDDFNTSEVFMPIHGTTFEQSQVYQDDVALLAPCDGRIVSVTLSIMSVTGNADLTVRVYTLGPNASGTSLSSWTLEESEVLPITSTDDSHVLHFSFSNAKHFESTEKFAVSIQADSDIMSNSFIYATTVVEWDYNTLLGSSAEYDSVP
tara:strand:+ start:3969 stop:5615 length:1647 start_codon:yes stop_codon:yes gene_type:complete